MSTLANWSKLSRFEILDVSIALLETKNHRIILVNGHIINVYRHTTSNPDKINWEELKPVLPCLSAKVEYIVILRAVRERCNFHKKKE